MTRIPKGAYLILNKVSGAPGFWIGNVIVMAGVPSIMQAMPDDVAPKLKIGLRILSDGDPALRYRVCGRTSNLGFQPVQETPRFTSIQGSSGRSRLKNH
jgi:hypothetical protein